MTTEEHLEKLELELQTLRRQLVSQVVTTKRLEICDDAGQTYAVLSFDGNGPYLRLLDDQLQTRLELSVRKRRPTGATNPSTPEWVDSSTDLILFDVNGERRVAIKVEWGTTRLEMFDAHGNESRAKMYVHDSVYDHGESSLVLADRNGRPYWQKSVKA